VLPTQAAALLHVHVPAQVSALANVLMSDLSNADKMDLQPFAEKIAKDMVPLLDDEEMDKALRVPAHALSLLFELSEEGSAFIRVVATRQTRVFLGEAVEIDLESIELSDESLRQIALRHKRMPEQLLRIILQQRGSTNLLEALQQHVLPPLLRSWLDSLGMEEEMTDKLLDVMAKITTDHDALGALLEAVSGGAGSDESFRVHVLRSISLATTVVQMLSEPNVLARVGVETIQAVLRASPSSSRRSPSRAR
jgi:hypothetical protein